MCTDFSINKRSTDKLMKVSALPSAQREPSHVSALCCCYFSVRFDEHPVQLLRAGGSRCDLTIAWALSVRYDFDWEVMGAWPMPAAGPVFCRGVLYEFKAWGIKLIPFVLSDAVGGMRESSQGAAMLLSFWRILSRGHASLASKKAGHRGFIGRQRPCSSSHREPSSREMRAGALSFYKPAAFSTRRTMCDAFVPNGLASLTSEVNVGCRSPRSSMLMKLRSSSASKPSCSCVSPAFLRRSRRTVPKAMTCSNFLSNYGWRN